MFSSLGEWLAKRSTKAIALSTVSSYLIHLKGVNWSLALAIIERTEIHTKKEFSKRTARRGYQFLFQAIAYTLRDTITASGASRKTSRINQ
jgi:hypothetical protein